MTEVLRASLRTVLGAVDRMYHRLHHLRPLGQVLLLGRTHYHGPAMTLPDGTQLAPGDAIGGLHFHNAGFIGLQAGSSRAAALSFARLMLQSMHALAAAARNDPRFADVEVFHATSWLPPHGQRLGFVTQPVPKGFGTRARAAYFKLLLWTFAPAQETRRQALPDPHYYWLTRKELLQRFGTGDSGAEFTTVVPAHRAHARP